MQESQNLFFTAQFYSEYLQQSGNGRPRSLGDDVVFGGCIFCTCNVIGRDVWRTWCRIYRKEYLFYSDEEDKRVINSDDYGKEVHPEIYHGKAVESEIKPFSFRQLGDETAASLENIDEQPEDFQEGMNVLSMEEVREEEKKIISEELNDEREKILQEARKEAEKIIDSANLSADDIKNQAFEEGKLADLTPTMLDIMGLKKPEEMTGESIIVEK